MRGVDGSQPECLGTEFDNGVSLTTGPPTLTVRSTSFIDVDRCFLVYTRGWLGNRISPLQITTTSRLQRVSQATRSNDGGVHRRMFELGHWLNENFVTGLWAILESNGIVAKTSKINRNVTHSRDMDLPDPD